MKIARRVLGLILLLIGGGILGLALVRGTRLGAGHQKMEKVTEAPGSLTVKDERVTHLSDFETRVPFEEVFQKAKQRARKVDVKASGGILPHHLLAAEVIAEFFRGIEEQSVSTVVFLGPNHRNLGDSNVVVSLGDWETPYGRLEVALSIVDELLKLGMIEVDERLIGDEHAISSLVPFVKRTFPKARVVTMMVRSDATEGEMGKLGWGLAEVLPEDGLVLVSSDFSHEVTLEVARENDVRSLEVIKGFEMDKVYAMETDANPAIYGLLTFLDRRRAREMKVVENKTSVDFVGGEKENDQLVTSYATVYFSDERLGDRRLSIEKLFDGGDGWWLGESEEDQLTVVVAGDVSLARAVNARLVREGGEGEIFGEVKEILESADLAMVNLEGPLLENCPVTSEGMKLCGSSRNVAGLVEAGVDVVSLANNHAGDFGEAGLRETEQLLMEEGIFSVKNGEMVIREIKGLRVAVVGFNLVGRKAGDEELAKVFEMARERADLVVGFFHWGREYTAGPTVRQREVARLVIDEGADLVVGSHPHWVQAVEIYRGKLIVYSHGNLVFDQLWSEETREGVMGKYVFDGDELVGVNWVPVYIEKDFIPVVANGSRRERILTRMRDASKKLVNKEVGFRQ